MWRGCLLVIVVGAALAGFPGRAEACTCIVGAPLCETFWKADVVFAGEVVEIAAIPNPVREGLPLHRRVRFRVMDRWRGHVGETVEIATGAGGGDCGYRFERGARYLVYASLWQGVLATSRCSRTRPLAEAAEDLAYLKTALQRPAAGRIDGRVMARFLPSRGQPPPGLSGYAVSLSNGRDTWTTTSDYEGRYEFTGMPAGEYEVRVVTPGTEHGRVMTVTLADPRGCARADLSVVPDGRLRVRLVDARGRPLEGIRVDLVNVETESRVLDTGAWQTRTDGEIEFSFLRPGRYALAVNRERPPSVEQPYAATYFPGADSLESATAVEVGYGERVDAGTWRLPEPLPARRITARVVYPDGTPARGASVVVAVRGGPGRYRLVDASWLPADAAGRVTLVLHDGVAYEAYAYVSVGEDRVQWTSPRRMFRADDDAGPLQFELRPPAVRK